MFRRMLVGLDGSDAAESILPEVLAFAHLLEAEVNLVLVLRPPAEAWPGSEDDTERREFLRQAEAEALDYLGPVARRAEAQGLCVRATVLFGNPAEELIDMARREHADLIALAPHGRTVLKRLLLGSVAEAVLRLSGTPVLLVPAAEAEAAPAFAVNELLVPLDGTPLAETVLPEVESMALRMRLRVILLQVVECGTNAPPAAETAGTAFATALPASPIAGADRYLKAVEERLRRHGVAAIREVATGSPAEVIARHLRANPAALVVMATRGWAGPRPGGAGSIARELLRAGLPALVVPPLFAPAAVS